MTNDTIIVTQPNLTTLYIGQLISKNSLPKLLEENFVTIDQIEFVSYTKELHLQYIEEAKKIYKHLKQEDFIQIH